jgi:hypothetical protein
MAAAAGMLFLQKGHFFIPGGASAGDGWGGGSDCGGMTISALQTGQLIDKPAPALSTTSLFPHTPQLKKMSDILNLRAGYLPGFWEATIHCDCPDRV